MNKKSAILFFSVLVLLSLGVLYVFGADMLKYGEESGTNTVVTTAAPSPWIKGDSTKLLNITIEYGGIGNITNFTLTLDAEVIENANITKWSFLPVDFGDLGDNGDGGVVDGSNLSNGIRNCTYDNNGKIFGGNDAVGDWLCFNSSAWTIDCNSTINASNLQTGFNTTITLVLNVTGASTSDETTFLVNITAEDGATGEGILTAVNHTNVTAYVDDQYPRLVEVNISDGNTTYANGTWSMKYYLNGPITIESLIEDSQLEGDIVFGYNCNATNGSFAQDSLDNGGWYAENALTVTNQNVGTTIDQKGNVTSSSINCYSLYSAGISDGDLGIVGANETFTFGFLVNDSFNHRIMLNGTGDQPEIPFNITLDDGELLPTIERVNVTQTTMGTSDGDILVSKTLDDHTSGALDGANDYLAANTATFEVELKGGYKPANVYIVWNDTGAATTTFAPAVIGDTGAVFPYMTNLDETIALNLTNRSAGAANLGSGDAGDQAGLNGTTIVYYTTKDLSGNDSNNFAFWVYANNTGDNYTRIAGPYRFIVDGGAPSITMTAPTDRTITPRGSITYSCKATDSASGVYQIMWQLKKPGETAFTEKQGYASLTDGTDSIIFTGDDTNLAGDYDVKCLAIDTVGNEGYHTTSSLELFSVHYSTTGGAGEGAAAAADIDLSTQEEVTITEKQGVISTFTLDGTTVHTIKIKTVDEIAGTVTIIIESDPIEITLKIGETKEVDIDADGANDISVTLNKITDGAADITTKRLTPLPAKEVPTEEVPPTEKPTEEITPEAAPSKTWLWILIIVIIVVIGVGYWFMKRK